MISASERFRCLYVENIPAEETEAGANPWVSAEKPEARRTTGACAETQEGQGAPCRIRADA